LLTTCSPLKIGSPQKAHTKVLPRASNNRFARALVLVTSYSEALSFSEWLFIGKCYLDSEASYYPISEGYLGKAMLLNALNELSHGVPFDKVLERYKLKRKGKSLNVVDKRKRRGLNRVLTSKSKLTEVLE